MSKPLRGLSLCSGIGGLDIAFEAAGGVVAGQVELDPFCQRVLARHWPDVRRLSDLREVHGDECGPLDCIFGGFPCQPNSMVGKRRGSAEPRNLWPEFTRILRTARPRWFVGENVDGLRSVESGWLFGAILSDLAALGYHAGWCVLSAASVGAPHLRERIFIVAYRPGKPSFGVGLADTERQRGTRRKVHARDELPALVAGAPSSSSAGGARSQDVGDALRLRRRRRADNAQHLLASGRVRQHGTSQTGALADAAPRGLRRGTPSGQSGQPSQSGEGVEHPNGQRRAQSEPAGESDSSALDTWRAHSPGTNGRQAQSGLGRELDGLSAWLDRFGGWRGWPAGPHQAQYAWEAPRTTQANTPNRAARLKALGNAVVPQQAYPIFAAFIAYEDAQQMPDRCSLSATELDLSASASAVSRV